MKTRRPLPDGGVKRHEPQRVRGVSSSDWTQVTNRVLERATELGFVRVGVVSLEPFVDPITRLETFLQKGRGGNMAYLAHRQPNGTLTRSDPRLLFPSAERAVVAALPYPNPSQREAPRAGEIAKYALGQDYHHVLKEKLLLLADAIAEMSGTAVLARACVDTAPLLERDLAIRAGFAFLGKNTLTIAPGAGSHFLLGELLVDAPLEPTRDQVSQGCGSCTACLDACPTSAFSGPFELDATRCISYLTIESGSDVPRPLRAGIGNRLFGCDACQAVCPYNRSTNARPAAPELDPRPELMDLTPETVLTMGSSAYKRLVRGSALRRASRNQLARNAAIVLGNRGNEAAVPLLVQQAESHASKQVRLHCVWALGTLLHDHGAGNAEPALRELTGSSDPDVVQEAMTCLDLHAFEEARGPHSSTDTHRDEGVAPPHAM